MDTIWRSGHNVHRQLHRLGEYTILGMSYSPAYNDPSLAEKWCNKEKELAYYDSLPYADIIISHCPPSNCGELDTCPFSNEKNLGSQGFYEYIIREQPKYVFCGHIHQKKVLKCQLRGSTIYNVATQELYIEI